MKKIFFLLLFSLSGICLATLSDIDIVARKYNLNADLIFTKNSPLLKSGVPGQDFTIQMANSGNTVNGGKLSINGAGCGNNCSGGDIWLTAGSAGVNGGPGSIDFFGGNTNGNGGGAVYFSGGIDSSNVSTNVASQIFVDGAAAPSGTSNITLATGYNSGALGIAGNIIAQVGGGANGSVGSLLITPPSNGAYAPSLFFTANNGQPVVGFKAPDVQSGYTLYDLPATDGTAGQALVTVGSGVLTGKGTLYWAGPYAQSDLSNTPATTNILNPLTFGELASTAAITTAGASAGNSLSLSITTGTAGSSTSDVGQIIINPANSIDGHAGDITLQPGSTDGTVGTGTGGDLVLHAGANNGSGTAGHVIIGPLKFPNSAGDPGQSLLTNGSDTMSWGNPSPGLYVSGTASSPVTVGTAGISLPGLSNFNTVIVRGDGSPTTVSAVPQIQAGTIVGQALNVICPKDGSHSILLHNGDGLSIGGNTYCGYASFPVGPGMGALNFIWDGSVWVLTSYLN
jgi:hypothetical protein